MTMTKSVPKPISKAVNAADAAFNEPSTPKASPKVIACPTSNGTLE